MMKEILFQIIIFLSNTIQIITGFAGTLLAMPLSIRVVGIEEARTVLNLFTMIACAWITFQSRKYINRKVLFKMVCGMLAGMLIGVWLSHRVPTESLLMIYGILIIGVALSKLYGKGNIILPKWATILLLTAAGIIHGMFLSGGALLVIYAVQALKDKNEFRATIAPVWVILNGILAFTHYRSGYLTVHNLQVVAISMIPLVASVIVGNYLYRKINQKQFLKMTYILLLFSGISIFL